MSLICKKSIFVLFEIRNLFNDSVLMISVIKAYKLIYSYTLIEYLQIMFDVKMGTIEYLVLSYLDIFIVEKQIR